MKINDERARDREEKKKGAKQELSDDVDILNSVFDLAAIRIVLYHPSNSQRADVRRLLQAHFGDSEPDWWMRPHDPKERPRANTSGYHPRSLTYFADHYYVKMKKGWTSRSYTWLSTDKVEIQVVSALGHAIQEARHDINYKELRGKPTIHEERIIDALHGMVNAGDVLLAQLHELVLERTDEVFESSGALHRFLIPLLRESQSGGVPSDFELPYQFLKPMDMCTSSIVQENFDALQLDQGDFESLRSAIESRLDSFNHSLSLVPGYHYQCSIQLSRKVVLGLWLIDNILRNTNENVVNEAEAKTKAQFSDTDGGDTRYKATTLVACILCLLRFTDGSTDYVTTILEVSLCIRTIPHSFDPSLADEIRYLLCDDEVLFRC